MNSNKRRFVRSRVDGNQPEIVKEFRAYGCTVRSVHTIGKGFPDILVGYHGKNILVEIKDGSKPPSGRKLTDDEIVFHDTWRGQVAIVYDKEDVPQLLELFQEN